MFSISTLALNPSRRSPNVAKISNSFRDYRFIQTLSRRTKVVIAESLNKFGSPDVPGERIESNSRSFVSYPACVNLSLIHKLLSENLLYIGFYLD
jgi:hypothetical protein